MKRSAAAVGAVALLAAVATAWAASSASAASDRAAERAQTTEIQLLGLNDFHGNLEPIASGSAGRIGGIAAGGVEYLATHVDNLRATNPNTLFVSAGDLIGATPLISAVFHDEPTIEAFNLMGLDYNGVGNHEFDEGVDELLRMQNGGCHPVDGCQDGDGFAGADFQFLAANVAYKDSGKTIFPPFRIEHFNGVKIAIIGMTLEGTPEIVTPAGISNVNFADEAATVNALVPVLRRQGVETFVVLLHEGGFTSSTGNGTGGVATKPEDTFVNKCEAPTGPVPTIVAAMDDAIDVVMTGHTNWAVNCVLDGKIVTGAGQGGRLVTDVDLTLSRATKDVVAAKVNNVIVTRDVAKAPALTTLVDRYRTLSAPLANRIVGAVTKPILRAQNPAGESALGDVIADSQRFATEPASLGGAQIAFMNPGGIRADLPCVGTPPCDVTYGQIFTVQPFGNSLVTMTLTGTQVERALEQQWQAAGVNVLQVSSGFTYTWDSAGPLGARVDPSTIKLNGTTLDPAASYRVTVNSFLATGGDRFSVFNEGTNRLGGDVDLDAVEKYFLDQGVVSPGPQDRITRL